MRLTGRWRSIRVRVTGFGATVTVRNDRNLVIYAGGRAVWDRVTKG
ncbi:hypothetical protein GCM10009805_01930 [Leucobacter chromiireducens subsp. solipictus]